LFFFFAGEGLGRGSALRGVRDRESVGFVARDGDTFPVAATWVTADLAGISVSLFDDRPVMPVAGFDTFG